MSAPWPDGGIELGPNGEPLILEALEALLPQKWPDEEEPAEPDLTTGRGDE